MTHHEIQEKYEKLGCLDFTLKNSYDLKNILSIDLEQTMYWNELSFSNKKLVEAFVLKYLNCCGLKYREGYQVVKAYRCKEYKLIYGDSVVGSRMVNVNNLACPKEECSWICDNYSEIEDLSIWIPINTFDRYSFIRVDLINSYGDSEWFHVLDNDGVLTYY